MSNILIAIEIQSKLIRNFIYHSFNDKPAVINSKQLLWFKDGLERRENDGYSSFCIDESENRYWKRYLIKYKSSKARYSYWCEKINSKIKKEFNKIKG